ncbi:MAG: hypothetical protein MRJ92_01960 [Nitrospira sp.]|nr:hypothetical protein [Nitrospira sp.]
MVMVAESSRGVEEASPFQVRVFEICPLQVGAVEPGITEIGTTEARLVKVHLDQGCIVKIGASRSASTSEAHQGRLRPAAPPADWRGAAGLLEIARRRSVPARSASVKLAFDDSLHKNTWFRQRGAAQIRLL